MINPDRFLQCFAAWIPSVAQAMEGQVVAVVGKALRRSHDSKYNRSPIHIAALGPILECRFFISSFENDAKLFARAVRSHREIENSCHRVLDMVFSEVESRVKRDHGPENVALLHHIALNLIQEQKTAKIEVKNKHPKAGWDNRYLVKVVFGNRNHAIDLGRYPALPFAVISGEFHSLLRQSFSDRIIKYHADCCVSY